MLNVYHAILTKKEFTSSGKKEKIWYKAGNIKTLPNGRIFMTLNNQPDTNFYIFPNDEELPDLELPVID